MSKPRKRQQPVGADWWQNEPHPVYRELKRRLACGEIDGWEFTDRVDRLPSSILEYTPPPSTSPIHQYRAHKIPEEPAEICAANAESAARLERMQASLRALQVRQARRARRARRAAATPPMSDRAIFWWTIILLFFLFGAASAIFGGGAPTAPY
jgi:hypothetical protein